MRLVPVRYPPPASWDAELDARDRAFDEEAAAGIIRLDDHLRPDAVQQRLAHLDRLAAGGSFQPPRRRREPTWHGWLAVLLVPIAALCAVGWTVAVVG